MKDFNMYYILLNLAVDKDSFPGGSDDKESESESLSSVVSDALQPHGLYSPWNSLGQNTGVGSLSFLQGVFPIQGSNPGLPHCRQILYHLIHKGSPRILEWISYPFSRGSFWPRTRTRVSCITERFFTNWVIRKAQMVKNLPAIQAIWVWSLGWEDRLW